MSEILAGHRDNINVCQAIITSASTVFRGHATDIKVRINHGFENGIAILAIARAQNVAEVVRLRAQTWATPEFSRIRLHLIRREAVVVSFRAENSSWKLRSTKKISMLIQILATLTLDN